jgi:hypothetical protein
VWLHLLVQLQRLLQLLLPMLLLVMMIIMLLLPSMEVGTPIRKVGTPGGFLAFYHLYTGWLTPPRAPTLTGSL